MIPRNTPAGVRVVVRSGATEFSRADLLRFLNGPFDIEAELSGPGLGEALTLSERIDTAGTEPMLLRTPPIALAGDYTLQNPRIVVSGQTVLDITPSRVPVRVIDEVLVTSVTTRPLTMQEIRDKGIALDSDDYLGFEFTLGLRLDSKVVNIDLPVVFDRSGVPLPELIHRPDDLPFQSEQVPLPEIVPMLLRPPGARGEDARVELPDGRMVELRIPSLLVIPGNVGYLKQMFSAQLFVANGAPAGSGLTLREIAGTIHLPDGDDHDPDSGDEPLVLADLVSGPQAESLAVMNAGADGKPGTADDRGTLIPAEQGQAEFLLRGEREGFHTLGFDIRATLDGLATGSVELTGHATGGVLVRNPFFDMSFTVPAVVRSQESFKVFVMNDGTLVTFVN